MKGGITLPRYTHKASGVGREIRRCSSNVTSRSSFDLTAIPRPSRPLPRRPAARPRRPATEPGWFTPAKVPAVTEPTSPVTAGDLIGYLDELGIDTSTVEHPAVFTVDEARRLRGDLPGAHSKSLFLRNKKGRMWLVVTLEDRDIDLKDLGERLGAGRLSFGSADRLLRYLGVIPGAVTPFGVINDHDQAVRVALDRQMMEVEPLNFHPLDNTKTTAISAEGLLRFLHPTGHIPELLDL